MTENIDNARDSAVQDTESRLQQAARIARLGHYLWDAVTDKCIFCSEEHAKIHGMSVDEYVERSSTMDGLAHPDDREAVKAAFRALREGENFELEYRIIIPSGDVRFIREIGRPIKDENGLVVQEIGTCQDITKGKQIELALRENERRLKSAQRIARLGSWEIDSEGNRKNWSVETYQLLGVPGEAPQHTSMGFYSSVHPEDMARVQEQTEQALRERTELDITYRFICPDGSYRTLHEVAAVSSASVDGLMMATVQDITERVRLEEKLNQAQKIEAVGKLTGGIAHDFNNLLGVIQGNAELLSLQKGVDHALTTAILAAAERGAELTSRLLSFSRRQPLDTRVVDPAELVSELRLMLDRTLGEAINIDIHVPPSLWACLVDPGQLENALLNLAINARDAMPRGGTISIACDNRHFSESDQCFDIDDEPMQGDFVEVSVRDHGTGMSADVQKHCIEPFYTTKGDGHGSGLGLSMVYGFIKQTSGHMRIRSREGEGTAIVLYLPKSDVAPTRRITEQPTAGASQHAETILILEDDPDLLKLVAKMASEVGYNTLVASSASEARGILKDKVHFDALVTDILLGSKTSGPEFAAEVLAQRPGTPVVFMSGYSEEVAKDRGVLGKDRVLLKKPFHLNELAAALRHSLDAA